MGFFSSASVCRKAKSGSASGDSGLEEIHEKAVALEPKDENGKEMVKNIRESKEK
jgi:hypothetical protein